MNDVLWCFAEGPELNLGSLGDMVNNKNHKYEKYLQTTVNHQVV